MNCWATHSYWPLCALNPWEMTTTACGLPAGCHSRVKILIPSTPLKLPSVMVESPHPDGACRDQATLHRPSQGDPTMQQWLHRASHAGAPVLTMLAERATPPSTW